jgi:hypothetical protein
MVRTPSKEQLNAVNAQHGRQWMREASVRDPIVLMGFFLPQLLSGNQLNHPYQNYLSGDFTHLGLALGSGEDDLIHGGNKFYAVDDDLVIANIGELFVVLLVL